MYRIISFGAISTKDCYHIRTLKGISLMLYLKLIYVLDK
jgi:hypothetical protein